MLVASPRLTSAAVRSWLSLALGTTKSPYPVAGGSQHHDGRQAETTVNMASFALRIYKSNNSADHFPLRASTDTFEENKISCPILHLWPISALTDAFSRIGLLAYSDYCDSDLLEWSGWLEQDSTEENRPSVDLVAAVRALSASGGGDYLEATKTGLAKAYEVMREDVTTTILLYTDARMLQYPSHAKLFARAASKHLVN